MQGPEDVSNFLKYAIALTRVHLQLSKLVTPVVQNRRRHDCCLAHEYTCSLMRVPSRVNIASLSHKQAVPLHIGRRHDIDASSAGSGSWWRFGKRTPATAPSTLRMQLNVFQVNSMPDAHRERRLAEIREVHARYSSKQLENDKTTRVLEAGFGKEFTDRYMRTGVYRSHT